MGQSTMIDIVIKFIKKIIIWMVFIFVLLLTIFMFFVFFPVGDKLAQGVNQKNILSLKIGMSEHEVISILGEPISIPVRYTKGIKTVQLKYGESGILGFGADIDIILEDNKMNKVIIAFWDASFYYCSDDTCPGIGEPFWFNWYIPKN